MQRALAGSWSGDKALSPAQAIGKARTPWAAVEERVTVNGKMTLVPAKCAPLNTGDSCQDFWVKPEPCLLLGGAESITTWPKGAGFLSFLKLNPAQCVVTILFLYTIRQEKMVPQNPQQNSCEAVSYNMDT